MSSLTNIMIGNCQFFLYEKGKFIGDNEYENQDLHSPEVEK